MNCNCVEEILERAKKALCENKGIDENNVVNMEMSGILYTFDKGIITSNKITMEHKYIAKTSGKERIKKEKVNMEHSYCPFCGKSNKEVK